MGWLKERYEVRYERRIFEHTGYLAGSDEARQRELGQALVEADVAAIFCARGGYGGNRFAHELAWEALRERPRWIVGFSDVTALHVEAARIGVASIHGANLTGLGRGDARTREQLVSVLEGGAAASFRGLRVLQAGTAAGRLCGGNLTLLHSCAAAQRLVLPEGGVLLLEDVAERPYRLDRMLTTLVVGGHLDAISAVVVGELDRCGPGADGVEALDAIHSSVARLGVPVVADLPIGHGLRNEAVMLGADAVVTAADEGAVELS